MASRDEVKQIIGKLIAAFPNWNIGDLQATLDVWAEMLAHLPGDQLKAATLALIAEPGRAFAPSIGEVIGKVVHLTARANNVPSAAQAWNEASNAHYGHRFEVCEEGARLRETPGKGGAEYMALLRALDEHEATCTICGWVENNPFTNPIVEKVARSLGWPRHFEIDDFTRAAFIKAYENELRRAELDAATPPAVQDYLALSGGVNSQIKQLTQRMAKK